MNTDQRNLLEEFVSISSVYPHEQQLSSYCQQLLKSRNFSVIVVETEDGRQNILAQKGKGGSAICFYGHLDTVPIGDQNAWETDPLKLTEKDGNYYGLGVSDNKGGIAAFLTALQNFDGYVKVVLAVDEENISEGAWTIVKKQANFFADVRLVIHTEPTINMPEYAIANGRVGRRIFKAQFKGKPEHIYNYKKADDAIKKLGDYIHDLYQQRDHMFKSPHSVIQVRRVSGEAVGMSVPGSAEALIEALLGDGDSETDLMERLRSIGNVDIQLAKRKTPYLDPYLFKTFPHQSILEHIIKDNFNHEMELVYRSSVADENVIATLGIPVITWGPKGGNEHIANEYINIESFDRLIMMYKTFLAGIESYD